MGRKETSMQERNRLYRKASIPMVISLCLLLLYFVYLMHENALKNSWDFLIRFGLPFMSIPIIVGILSFELLYHRKTGGTLQFHLKRFGMNATLALCSIFSLVAFLLLADFVLSPFLGKWGLMLGAVVWTAIFATIVVKYQRFFGKF